MDSAHQHMHNCGRELMLAIVENHWQDAHFDAFQEGLLSFTAALTDYKIYLLTIRSNMDVLTDCRGVGFLMNPLIISYATLSL